MATTDEKVSRDIFSRPLSKNFGSVLQFAAVVLMVSLLLSNFIPAGQNAENKPFNTFDDFFPFYMTQHTNLECRRLHFAGTSLIVLSAVYDPSIVISGLLAGYLGLSLFPVTKAIPHGLFEMLLLFLTFITSMRVCTGKWSKGIQVLLVGYGFAWVGHFYFEHNKPATFIYPTYSLMGDLKLWYQIATQELSF